MKIENRKVESVTPSKKINNSDNSANTGKVYKQNKVKNVDAFYDILKEELEKNK